MKNDRFDRCTLNQRLFFRLLNVPKHKFVKLGWPRDRLYYYWPIIIWDETGLATVPTIIARTLGVTARSSYQELKRPTSTLGSQYGQPAYPDQSRFLPFGN